MYDYTYGCCVLRVLHVHTQMLLLIIYDILYYTRLPWEAAAEEPAADRAQLLKKLGELAPPACICACMCIHTYIYIYIYRERDICVYIYRERESYIYTHMLFMIHNIVINEKSCRRRA